MPLPLILTRPLAQSRALAAALPGLRVVLSPVLEIVPTGAVVDLGPYRGVIVTSANGAMCGPDLVAMPAYCVGRTSAGAARDRGAEVRLTAQNADDLLTRFDGAGPLLHLRGEYARGGIANRLSLAGIETEEAIVYRQEAVPLTAEARALIEGEAPVVLPLFSPRSAALVAADVVRVGPGVRAIAMSDAVARAWGHPTDVVEVPTGEAMRARIRAACEGMAP